MTVPPTETPTTPTLTEAPIGANALQAALQKLKADTASGAITWGDDEKAPQQVLAKPTEEAQEPDAQQPEPQQVEETASDVVPEVEIPEGYVQQSDGRWKGPDGKYAKDPTKPEEDASKPEVFKVSIPGRQEGEEVEVETEDQQLVERLNQLKNQVMNNKRYQELRGQAEEAIIQAKAQMETFNAAPEVFASQLPAEKQVEMATDLLARNWQALLPTLEKFATDPAAVWKYMAESAPRIEQKKTLQREAEQRERYTQSLIRTVNAKLPDTVTEADGRLLWDVLSPRLAEEVNKGIALTPQNVLSYAEPVMRRLNLWVDDLPSATTTGNGNGKSQDRQTAKAPPAKAPETQKQRSQVRLAQIARQREIARHTSPQGVGSLPATAPATANAVRDLAKQHGGLKGGFFNALRSNPDLFRTGAGT